MANILKCNNDDGLHFLYLFCKWKEAEVENIWGAVQDLSRKPRPQPKTNLLSAFSNIVKLSDLPDKTFLHLSDIYFRKMDKNIVSHETEKG